VGAVGGNPKRCPVNHNFSVSYPWRTPVRYEHRCRLNDRWSSASAIFNASAMRWYRLCRLRPSRDYSRNFAWSALLWRKSAT